VTGDDRVAALYELAPEEFIAARDRLAKELREGGDRDGAADVRKLKRPSMAAWVLNQLVRRHGAEVEELISAGQRLREAQRAALEGGDRSALREAGAARRTLTDRLVDLSRDILTEAGHAASRTHLDRVERTLQAATLSEEAAAELRGGTLERELEPPEALEALGVWDLPEPTPLAPRGERVERRAAEARKAEEEAEAAEEEARRVARAAEEAERAADEARRAAKRAASTAERARRQAEDLRKRADRD
jgi:hypothetical protein